MLGADRAGEIEPAGAWVLVDGAAGGAEHAGDLLPFVEQHGLAQAAQRRVGVGGERGGLRLGAQLDDCRGPPAGSSGLARGTGPVIMTAETCSSSSSSSGSTRRSR